LARIFFALALFAVLMLLGNIILGFTIGDFNGQSQQVRLAQQRLAALERAGERGRSPGELIAQRARLKTLSQQFQVLRQRKELHFLFGLAGSLVTVLVNSITVTYFIGTSRWCREVVDRYGLDNSLALQSNQLKRKSFPWALVGISVMLAIIVLGAAADPSANMENAIAWVMPHYLSAIVGTGLIAMSFWVQVGNIGINYEVIEQILSEVRRIRAERGLDSD
jgi:hypothetical protein